MSAPYLRSQADKDEVAAPSNLRLRSDLNKIPLGAPNNILFSHLSWNRPFAALIPLPINTITTDDKQHFIWQPASPVWGAVAGAQVYPSMLIAASF